jgi:hypothetical protein
MLNCVYFNMKYFDRLWNFSEWEKQKYLPDVTFSFLKFLYQIPCLIFLLAFCYFYLSHSHTAMCYIAISNIQQPYMSVSVSCDTKEHQYTFRTASYSRSHSHTAIWYIAISNTQQPYISVSVSCDTKKRQYTFRTASYSRSHSHTTVTDWPQPN